MARGTFYWENVIPLPSESNAFDRLLGLIMMPPPKVVAKPSIFGLKPKDLDQRRAIGTAWKGTGGARELSPVVNLTVIYPYRFWHKTTKNH
jgi:hypothetical protein